jgi:hypothetical protein
MHPRCNYLRASIEADDKEVLHEIEPLIEEALEALRRGEPRKAEVLLETALCNPDPHQGEKYRERMAGREFKYNYAYIGGAFYPERKPA